MHVSWLMYIQVMSYAWKNKWMDESCNMNGRVIICIWCKGMKASCLCMHEPCHVNAREWKSLNAYQMQVNGMSHVMRVEVSWFIYDTSEGKSHVFVCMCHVTWMEESWCTSNESEWMSHICVWMSHVAHIEVHLKGYTYQWRIMYVWVIVYIFVSCHVNGRVMSLRAWVMSREWKSLDFHVMKVNGRVISLYGWVMWLI